MYKNWLLLSLLICNCSFAQNTTEEYEELDELVIEENRMQISFQEISRNIQILSKEDISILPAQSINELLTYIAGVDIRQRGPFGMQTDVSIDGGSFEQTMILWNGVKMGDAQTAHHSMNVPIPLDAIERIEILKGPAARIYGINALTGAINIVTKKQSDDFLVVDISGGSSFRKKDEEDGNGIYAGTGIQTTAGFTTNNIHQLLSMSYNNYNGQRYNTASQSIKAMYQGTTKIDASNEVQWMSGYVKNDFGANGFYAAPYDKESFEKVQTLVLSVGSTNKISDRFSIKPRLSNRYNEDDYRFYRNDISKSRSLHYSNAFMLELNTLLESSLGNFGWGYEWRLEQIHSSNLGAHQRNNHGWYAEYKNNQSLKWNISLGAYWNYNSDFGFQWYPGADVSYKIDTHWKTSLSVGSSQRIPSFTDLYLNQRPGNIGNPELKPESAWQYEFGIRYNKDQKNFQFSYFDRNISDFIDWIRISTEEPYQPHNVGTQNMKGVFLKWSDHFQLNNKNAIRYSTSYQYLSPKSNDENTLSKYIIESLKHQLILGVNYSYTTYGIQWQNRWIKRELNEAYIVSDLKIYHHLNKLDLYVQVTNLFNTKYKEIAAVPMPSRWIHFGIKYKLI